MACTGALSAAGRLEVYVGDALGCQAPTEDGFAGLIVDMFSDGAVIPALQQPETWQRLRERLKPGGK
jgi:spermidine synthase